MNYDYDYIVVSKEILKYIGRSGKPYFDYVVDYALINGKEDWLYCLMNYTEFFLAYVESYNHE